MGRQTRVHLIRHGETDWNRLGRLQGREDIPLNALGREQAQALAVSWPHGRPAALQASPLKRAWETAEVLGAAWNLRPEAEPAWVERDWGAASGLLNEERVARWGWAGPIPDWEPFENLKDRALAALNAWADRHAGKESAVVTHGAVINALLWLATCGRQGTGITTLANGSITTLVRVEGGWVSGAESAC